LGICPVCNGFVQLLEKCRNCTATMEDGGKISDFFDDYSPHQETDWLKMEDGFSENRKNGYCAHLLLCPNCGSEEFLLIKE